MRNHRSRELYALILIGAAAMLIPPLFADISGVTSVAAAVAAAEAAAEPTGEGKASEDSAAAAEQGTGSPGESARAALQERIDGHRSLRGNPEAQTPPSSEPQSFTGYHDAPEFSVVSRREALSVYPCEDCHGMMPPNPQRRHLYAPHAATLDHGDGRMWCLDCHEAENRNQLRTLAGENVEFDEAYLVCGQCHYQPQKDWYYGAHGKRVGNWQGERVLYNCTHCHNPHAPAVRPRAPEAPPPIRRGLAPMPISHDTATHGSGAYTGATPASQANDSGGDDSHDD